MASILIGEVVLSSVLLDQWPNPILAWAQSAPASNKYIKNLIIKTSFEGYRFKIQVEPVMF